MKDLYLKDFDFDLPGKLIAQRPASPRDHARLLIYDRKSKSITDDYFYNIDKYLLPGTSIVVNNSKVEKCRLKFGSKEIFVLEAINPNTVTAMVRPGKQFQVGKTTVIDLVSSQLQVETTDISASGIRTLKLSLGLDNPELSGYKQTPFPPYIDPNVELEDEYQTVYADPLGSKAAPTAGLHFTDKLLEDLSKSHPLVAITLHVGLGTFAPVKESIDSHVMHSENYEVNEDAARALNSASSITAVGTTVARTLESIGRPFKASANSTDIFIRPGYNFGAIDSLLTNFHLPKSTLLMLVAAFMGDSAQLQTVYAHAIQNKYRFYSFGDAMLIL